jgi:hypothetical protein
VQTRIEEVLTSLTNGLATQQALFHGSGSEEDEELPSPQRRGTFGRAEVDSRKLRTNKAPFTASGVFEEFPFVETI